MLSRGIRPILQAARGATPDLSSWLASMVLGAGACGTFFGGWLTDWLVRKTGNRAVGPHGAGRRRRGDLAALGILASLWTDSTVMASAFVAAGRVRSAAPASRLVGQRDPGQRPAPGRPVRADEHDGWLRRILSQLFVGRFADWRKSLGYTGRDQWDPALYAYVAIALIGMVLWA